MNCPLLFLGLLQTSTHAKVMEEEQIKLITMVEARMREQTRYVGSSSLPLNTIGFAYWEREFFLTFTVT